MSTSGEAADHIVRMSMEVGEAALKISGAGAKHLAVLLYAVLKEKKKTKGRARLETLVRSEKPLTVFSVKENDLQKFVHEAKRYGILYCAVRAPKRNRDGMVDIMVKEEDAPRVNRIVERFQIACVSEAATVRTEIEKTREDKNTNLGDVQQAKVKQDKTREDIIVDELLGSSTKKDAKDRASSTVQEKPFFGEARTSPPSGHISERQGKTIGSKGRMYVTAEPEKPSVRKQLQDIRASRNKKAGTVERDNRYKSSRGGQNPLYHTQLQTKRKLKKSKER